MKPRNIKTIHILLLALFISTCFVTGCTTTRSQNGVIIQESGGLNPFNYLNLF